MLLSLVVIFTQSIQLSKIVCSDKELSDFALILCYCYLPLRQAGDMRLRDMLKDQPPQLRKLNLEQVAMLKP